MAANLYPQGRDRLGKRGLLKALPFSPQFAVDFDYFDARGPRGHLPTIYVPKELLTAFSENFRHFLQLNPTIAQVQWIAVFPNTDWAEDYRRDHAWKYLQIFVQWLYTSKIDCASNKDEIPRLFHLWIYGSALRAPVFQNSVLRHFGKKSSFGDFKEGHGHYAFNTEVKMTFEGGRELEAYHPTFFEFCFAVVVYRGSEDPCWRQIIEGGGKLALRLARAWEDTIVHQMSGERKVAPWEDGQIGRYLISEISEGSDDGYEL